MESCKKEFILNGVHPRKEICGNFKCPECKFALSEQGDGGQND